MSVDSEQALTSTVASLMHYDNANKRWNDLGQSTLQIYQNSSDNTFRVVGSSRHTGQVTLDAPLALHLKYSRATEIFIQWRDPDSRQVYGLSFASKDAADGFQQWLDYATNPSSAALAPTRNVPLAQTASSSARSSSSSSGESHYQRPKQQPDTNNQQTSDGTEVDSHQQTKSRMPPSMAPPRPPGPPPPRLAGAAAWRRPSRQPS